MRKINYSSVFAVGILLTAVMFVLWACGGSAKTEEDVYVPDVYVVGFETDVNGNAIPKFWENGIEQDFIFDVNVCLYDVFVSDTDIYILGFDLNKDKWNPILWKNGVKQDFTAENCVVNSIFVSGTDVYIVGYEFSKGGSKYLIYPNIFLSFSFGESENKGKEIAKLWKNGVEQELSDGKNDTRAESVFVSDGNVYAVGNGEDNKGIWNSKLWKNGEEQNFINGERMWTRSIFVLESDVYVVGNEENKDSIRVAKLWKNGVEQILSDGKRNAYANSIFVLENDVYIVGYEENEDTERVAKLWKNGVEQILSDGKHKTSVESVFVFGDDVYIVGYDEKENKKDEEENDERENIDEKGVAKLWKNGVEQNLTDGKRNAYAMSVFVK